MGWLRRMTATTIGTTVGIIVGSMSTVSIGPIPAVVVAAAVTGATTRGVYSMIVYDKVVIKEVLKGAALGSIDMIVGGVCKSVGIYKSYY